MDDLISREALLKQIDQQRMASKTGFPKQSFVVGDAINCIRNAPAVEAEPVRHGRWLYTHVSNILLCSACGLLADAQVESKFCPKCGAKMDLEV